jgi:hypothetical protein
MDAVKSAGVAGAMAPPRKKRERPRRPVGDRLVLPGSTRAPLVSGTSAFRSPTGSNAVGSCLFAIAFLVAVISRS